MIRPILKVPKHLTMVEFQEERDHVGDPTYLLLQLRVSQSRYTCLSIVILLFPAEDPGQMWERLCGLVMTDDVV